MIRLNICNVKYKAPRTKADKTGVKRVGAIDLGVNPLYTVHTSEGVTITEDAAEREKLFEIKAKCEHLVERIATRNLTTNERTVRPNDETIAIEVRKNACQFAEL